MKKLLFIDVDGTLIDSEVGQREVKEKVVNGLKTFRENGGKFFITTGRSYSFLPKSVRELECDGYIVCAGSFVSVDKKILRNETFDVDKIIKIFEKLKDVPMLYFVECGYETYCNDKNDEYAKSFMKKYGIDSNRISNLDTLEGKEINKISLTFRNMDDIKLKDEFEKAGFTVLPQPQEDSFDVTLKNSTKKDGIVSVRNSFKDESYVIAIGDSYNDMEMIVYASLGVAMGNAPKVVKDKADYITKSVHDDGVYYALLENKLI